MQERIQKILAKAGICSRRAAEQLIVSKRVTINGRIASLGDSADAFADVICVDRKRIAQQEKKTYIMLHKPRGYITSMHDEKGRRDIRELISDCPVRVYPIGRLDYDSEGLLLMTNNGAFAHRLSHPSHEVRKKYLVSVRGDNKNLPKLAEPMEIDGYTITPAKVQIIRQEEGRAVLHITITEGRNRQIRKMCEQCGFSVKHLKRESVGPIALDKKLPAGKWRELTEREIGMLTELIK